MEIKLIKFLNNTDQKTKNILVVGVVHGDEPQGEYLINKYILERNKNTKNNIYYIPRLNPAKTRKNLNGVDLNRNFPTKNWELTDVKDNYFGGFKPASEEETKFLIKLSEKIKFDCIITIHSPYKIINYDGCAENLARRISEFLNYPVQKDIGYPTKGSMGTYFGVEKNIPIITIEVDEEIETEKLYPSFKKLFEFLEFEF